MNQPIYQQSDPKTLETLKAASNQVMQADKNRDENIQAHSTFAEEFVQKLASIDQKTAAVDEEMAKLEARRNELIKVKDKLKELDKEMSNVLKS